MCILEERERTFILLLTPFHSYPRICTVRQVCITNAEPGEDSVHVLESCTQVQQIRRNPSDSPGRRAAKLRARNWTRSTPARLTGIASTQKL